MGPLGTHGIENKPINKNSSPNIDDSPLCDECKNTASEDEHFGDTVPCEDNDAFDTQVMDLDIETQPLDLCNETQILYLPGETQAMEDFDLDEYIDTQLLDVSDSENYSEDDEQGAERPQPLHETKEALGRSGDGTGASEENSIQTRHQDDRAYKMEALPADDSVPSSGSLRKGFTAIRTASLRAAGLKAQSKVSKDADHGSCSIEFSRRSSNLQCLSGPGGMSDVETVHLEHDIETDDEKDLSSGVKTKVARSLAKELFMEEDVAADEGCNNSHSSERTSFRQLPACDNKVAGLSYADSQEPGELTQANALDFVDRFLKVNVLESDQDIDNRNPTGEIVSPHAIAKGPQSLAQQTNLRNSLAGASVFDWDDNHEDEGGGEFFTKKKEVLFGTSCDAHRSCLKPRNPRHHGPNGSHSLGKLRNEEKHRNIHDKTMDLFQSDSKLLKRRRTSQHTEVNKKGDTHPDIPEGAPSYNGKVSAVTPYAEPTSMLDVGIDTQMAAEAMEALSNGNLLTTSNDGTAGEDHQNVGGKATVKNTLSKQGSVKKRPFISKSGTTISESTNRVTMKTGEESKSSVASRTRSQHTVGEFNLDMVKPKAKRRRLQRKAISAANERASSDRLVNIDGKEAACALDSQLNTIASLPRGKQKPQDKASVYGPVAQNPRLLKVVNHANGTDDEPVDSRGERRSLDVVQSGRGQTRCSYGSDVGSDNVNARKETLDMTTVAASNNNDKASCRQENLQHSSEEVYGSGKKLSLLRASGGHEVISQSIIRRTRSKRSARYAEFPGDGKVLRSRVVVLPAHACQLSSEKHQASSFPAKEAGPPKELEGSPIQAHNSSSSVNITPVNLKTPTSAVSPLCVGDGYPTQSCKKRSLSREFYRLTANELKCTSPSKDLRQRRDFNSVRVLFSQHLDDDVVRKQKRILSRLGVPVASSISEATHFVADAFVRTRNMLEAIACGKPVVTHLWLESCGQSNCFIDEKNYILRDAKKEKELGFSMPNSLTRASHYPLLEGRRVLVTPNVKPSKEIVSGLVKAVHGQAIERLCRSMSNNNRLPDDLLVLSCDEDLQECLALLEKGIAIYCSELLLSGIIIQKLEYERYRIFVDHVKRTRSTLWVKNGDKFLPVTVTK